MVVTYRSGRTGGFRFSAATIRQDGAEGCEALPEIGALTDILLQKFLHPGKECDGVINSRVAAALVRTHGNQVAILLISGQRLPELPSYLHLCGRRDLVHHTADGGFDVDGRVLTAFGDAPR